MGWLGLLAAAALALAAAGAEGQAIDASAWQDLKPVMPGAAVKRTNPRWPLSDQRNAGGWVRDHAFWDEFDGKELDITRWANTNPTWKGRQPGWFSPRNVEVRDGLLCLTARAEEPPAALKAEGYHTWTTAAVQSLERTLYGYYEVRAKPMRSGASSSFWFYYGEPKEWTEIDVFEIGGKAPGFERKQHITLHVMRSPTVKDHISVGSAYIHGADLADDFHVYGLEWDPKELRFYFDGALVRRGPNTHWHQPLTINFDSETMPEWFGLPKSDDLPSTFQIDYLRVWKKRS